MFCPALGIPEDPVSGNAHSMLAAYLWDLGQFGKNSTAFIGHQGRQMHRPGRVSVKLEVDQGSLVAAHIGGTAVIVSEGTLALLSKSGRFFFRWSVTDCSAAGGTRREGRYS